MKRLLLLLLALSCGMMQAMENQSALMVPSKLGNVALLHDDQNGFRVLREQGDLVPVQRANMDRELRGLSNEKLMGLVKAGGYLKLNQMENDGEYTVTHALRLKGGGAGGATAGFWLGKILVHGVVQPFHFWNWCNCISCCNPSGRRSIYSHLEKVTLLPAEYVSNVVGVGCGIALGTATGPV